MTNDIVVMWDTICPLPFRTEGCPLVYDVKIPDSEIDELVNLIGRPIDIVSKGWDVVLLSDDRVLRITPEDVATPDKEHPYADVDRPMVKKELHSPTVDGELNASRKLGCLRTINLLSVLISFSALSVGPAIVLPNEAVIPEGMRYGWDYFNPKDKRSLVTMLSDDQALVDLDIGFELVTTRYPSVTVYTRGFFVMVCQNGLPEDEEWVRFGTFSRRSLPEHREV